MDNAKSKRIKDTLGSKKPSRRSTLPREIGNRYIKSSGKRVGMSPYVKPAPPITVTGNFISTNGVELTGDYVEIANYEGVVNIRITVKVRAAAGEIIGFSQYESPQLLDNEWEIHSSTEVNNALPLLLGTSNALNYTKADWSDLIWEDADTDEVLGHWKLDEQSSGSLDGVTVIDSIGSDSYTVVGAGTESVNGEYVRNGEWDGANAYTLYDSEGVALYNIWLNDFIWWISSTPIGDKELDAVLVYANFNNPGTPPLDDWESYVTEDDPAPTLTSNLPNHGIFRGCTGGIDVE
jgi:hypothetical protein